MKTDYFYYAVLQVDENDKEISFVLRVNDTLNLVHLFDQYKAVNPYKTKKEALEVANLWNKWSVENNRYLFNRQYPARVFDA